MFQSSSHVHQLTSSQRNKMNLNLNGMVSMWKVREFVDKATNIVMNYTETEAKVKKLITGRSFY